MTPEETDTTVHAIFYEFDVDGRHYWECQTCSSAGSVPQFRDPEIHAERVHSRAGIYNLSTTNRRRWT